MGWQSGPASRWPPGRPSARRRGRWSAACGRARPSGPTRATTPATSSPCSAAGHHPACRPEHHAPAQCHRRPNTRHPGYAVSQQKRKLVEEIFGWLKTIALLRKTRHRGVRRVGWMFTFAAAVYNLVRIRNLTWAEAGT